LVIFPYSHFRLPNSDNLSSVLCYLSSVFCPLSSVFCHGKRNPKMNLDPEFKKLAIKGFIKLAVFLVLISLLFQCCPDSAGPRTGGYKFRPLSIREAPGIRRGNTVVFGIAPGFRLYNRTNPGSSQHGYFSYQNLPRRHHAAKRVAGISKICNESKISAFARRMVDFRDF